MNTDASDSFLDLQISGSALRVFFGDLTTVTADALVSSDDTNLTMSGGVSEDLRRVGGEEIIRQAHEQTPLALGDVAVTTAGLLKATLLFHAVVLDRADWKLTTKELIRDVVQKCLSLCDERKLRSIAFPALATGTAQLSPEASSMAMIVAIDDYLRRDTRVESVSIVLR